MTDHPRTGPRAAPWWLSGPRFLQRLTIAQRARLGIAVGAAVVVLVALAASLTIRSLTDTVSELVDQVRFGQQTTLAMKDAVSAENAGIQGYLITADPKYLDTFNQGHDRFTAAIALLNGPNSTAADRQAAAEMTALESEFRRVAQQEIDLAAEQLPGSAAFAWTTEGAQAQQALGNRLDQLVAQRLDAVQATLADARQRESATRAGFVVLIAPTVALALLATFLVSRSITRRIERLENTIERIEQGDFRVDLPDRGHDELSRLAVSLRNMARALETETRAREHLLDERARDNEKISALYDVARSVNQSLDADEVLRLALARLLAHTQMRVGAAVLRDEDTGRFRVALVDGIGEEMAAEVAGLFEEDEAQALVGEILAQEGLTRIDRRVFCIDFDLFRTALAVPLRAQGTGLGVLVLATPTELTISDDEARLIEGLAKQVGTALEHARLYSQSRRLAATEERNRLARDLHDSVTQSLFSISMMAQALPSLIERNADRAVERAARLSDLARGALAEMRMLILELRPAALSEMGLVAALERYVAGIGSREGLDATFRVEGLQRRLPQRHEEALFRITQEALSNVARHARAQSVSVVLAFEPGDVELEICDDGVGIGQPVTGGFGMLSMRERAEALGGAVRIGAPSGKGCTVTVRVPAPAPTTSITA